MEKEKKKHITARDYARIERYATIAEIQKWAARIVRTVGHDIKITVREEEENA